MSKLYRVYILAEDGNNKIYDIEAVDHYKAIELGMDKAFAEEPTNRFIPSGFEEIEP
jgi:hypothetical protein